MVASDLHANVDRLPEHQNDTYILAEPPRSRIYSNPLADLLDWAVENKESVDYLIVPGDIANQADGEGLKYAWKRLHELAAHLGARLIAVPGNHDVVTHSHSADPRHHLKSLAPPFPTEEVATNEHFWRDGWVVLDDDPEVRLVLVDSTAAFPPFPSGEPQGSPTHESYYAALDRGSFTERVEDELEKLFRHATEKLNILITHHHPIEHQNVSHLRDTYGAMHRGGDLMDLLSRHPHMGRWIVIHGHKHIPQLVNAVATTASGPLILCAASLGHRLWHPINTVVRNQFHILSASNDPHVGLSSLRGEVHSFFWGFGVGWAPAETTGTGLPSQSGFGCTDDPKTLAHQIVQMMDDPQERLDLVRSSDLLARFPQLRFQLPADAIYLRALLEKSGFELIERRGRLIQLGRKE